MKKIHVSLNSIKRIKRRIITTIKADNSRAHKKIGLYEPVQVEKNVIIKGKLIKSPSGMYDSIKRATWIVGAGEENTWGLVLKIVPNRKKKRPCWDSLKKHWKNATVKTEGHKSCPYSVAGIEGDHIVVNHEVGFTNSEGYHTKLIECEWPLFKTDIKTRKGVPGFAMGGYVEEYMWRRRNIKEKTSQVYRQAFIKLVKLILEPNQ